MAKPMPSEPPLLERITVLMPIKRPAVSISAPPELPGLIAASVCTKLSTGSVPLRTIALTMPWVTVWPMPNGLPTASTTSPTATSLMSANAMGCRSSASILRRARSDCRVGTHDLREVHRAVVARDGELRCFFDDVIVGDDVSVAVDDDARSEPLGDDLGSERQCSLQRMRRVHGHYRRGGARHRVAVADDPCRLLGVRRRDICPCRGPECRHLGVGDERHDRHAVRGQRLYEKHPVRADAAHCRGHCNYQYPLYKSIHLAPVLRTSVTTLARRVVKETSPLRPDCVAEVGETRAALRCCGCRGG